MENTRAQKSLIPTIFKGVKKNSGKSIGEETSSVQGIRSCVPFMKDTAVSETQLVHVLSTDL